MASSSTPVSLTVTLASSVRLVGRQTMSTWPTSDISLSLFITGIYSSSRENVQCDLVLTGGDASNHDRKLVLSHQTRFDEGFFDQSSSNASDDDNTNAQIDEKIIVDHVLSNNNTTLDLHNVIKTHIDSGFPRALLLVANHAADADPGLDAVLLQFSSESEAVEARSRIAELSRKARAARRISDNIVTYKSVESLFVGRQEKNSILINNDNKDELNRDEVDLNNNAVDTNNNEVVVISHNTNDDINRNKIQIDKANSEILTPKFRAKTNNASTNFTRELESILAKELKSRHNIGPKTNENVNKSGAPSTSTILKVGENVCKNGQKSQNRCENDNKSIQEALNTSHTPVAPSRRSRDKTPKQSKKILQVPTKSGLETPRRMSAELQQQRVNNRMMHLMPPFYAVPAMPNMAVSPMPPPMVPWPRLSEYDPKLFAAPWLPVVDRGRPVERGQSRRRRALSKSPSRAGSTMTSASLINHASAASEGGLARIFREFSDNLKLRMNRRRVIPQQKVNNGAQLKSNLKKSSSSQRMVENVEENGEAKKAVHFHKFATVQMME